MLKHVWNEHLRWIVGITMPLALGTGAALMAPAVVGIPAQILGLALSVAYMLYFGPRGLGVIR